MFIFCLPQSPSLSSLPLSPFFLPHISPPTFISHTHTYLCRYIEIQVLHMRKSMYYLSSRASLILLNMISSSTCFLANGRSSSTAEWVCCVDGYHIFLMDSSVAVHLDWLHVMAAWNSAAISMRIQVSLSVAGFRVGIAGSRHSFSFLRDPMQ